MCFVLIVVKNCMDGVEFVDVCFEYVVGVDGNYWI